MTHNHSELGIDDAVRKFNEYCQGTGDFDELDLKEVIEDAVTEAYKRGYTVGAISELTKREGDVLLDLLKAITPSMTSGEIIALINNMRKEREA